MSTDLLEPELDSFSRPDRVRAWLRLSEGGGIRSVFDSIAYLDRALSDCEDEPELRALVLAKKAHQLASYVTAVRETEAWALEALPAARAAGPELERAALHGLGWARALRGLPIDDVCERFRACSEAAAHITDSPEPVQGLRLLWRGEIEPARTILTNLLAESDVRGEEVSYALQRLNLCDLELRAGNWDTAERLLDEWESADRQLLIEETYLRSRALLAVGRGFPQQAEPLAARSLAGTEPRGYYWQVNEARRALGVGALLAHDPGARPRASARSGSTRSGRESTSLVRSRSRPTWSRRSSRSTGWTRRGRLRRGYATWPRRRSIRGHSRGRSGPVRW